MSRVREVVVVHDSSCGGCADVAARLHTLLRRPVRLRSCRDPELPRAYPALRDLGCRAPALGVVRADGTVRWWVGPRAMLGALPLLRFTAPRRALRAGLEVQSVRRRRAIKP